MTSLGYRVDWPTADKDMIKLSRQYHNTLFELSMRGIINTVHFVPTKRWYFNGLSRDVEAMLEYETVSVDGLERMNEAEMVEWDNRT